MKAAWYFEKYKLMPTKPEKEANADVWNMLVEMMREMMDICKVRNVKFDRGAVAVTKEMNDKWNKIATLFEKEYGRPILNHDGFIAFLKHEMPELNIYI